MSAMKKVEDSLIISDHSCPQPLPDPRMENDFSPPMPYTLGSSATSKSTDSFVNEFICIKMLCMVHRIIHPTADNQTTEYEEIRW